VHSTKEPILNLGHPRSFPLIPVGKAGFPGMTGCVCGKNASTALFCNCSLEGGQGKCYSLWCVPAQKAFASKLSAGFVLLSSMYLPIILMLLL